MLGAAGHIDHRIAHHGSDDAVDNRACVTRVVDVGVGVHGVAASADVAGAVSLGLGEDVDDLLLLLGCGKLVDGHAGVLERLGP